MKTPTSTTARKLSRPMRRSDAKLTNRKEEFEDSRSIHSSPAASSDSVVIVGCDNDEPTPRISPRRGFAAATAARRYQQPRGGRGGSRPNNIPAATVQEVKNFFEDMIDKGNAMMHQNTTPASAPLPLPASAPHPSSASRAPQTPRDLELSKLRAQLEIAQAQKKALAARDLQQITPPTPSVQDVSTQTDPAPEFFDGTKALTAAEEFLPPDPNLCALPDRTMAPPPRQKALLKEKFVPYFSKLKTSIYCDTPPITRPVLAVHVIRTLSWNALGTLIATGAPDRTLRIWNPERTNVKYSTELRQHGSPVEWVEFNPTNESELASCTADGTVRIWDVRKKDCVAEIKIYGKDSKEGEKTFMAKEGVVDLLAWRPDGQELLVGTKAKSPSSTPTPLIQIPRSTLTPSTPLKPPAPISSFSFTYSTTSPALIHSSPNGTLTLSNYPSLTPLHTLYPHSSPITSHALSPPSTLLATGGSDALITLWDTTDWVCVRKLDRNIGPVTSVSFSFDGSYICGGCDEGVLEVAHAESGEYVWSSREGGGCVAWHPRNYALAYTGEYGLKIIGGIGA